MVEKQAVEKEQAGSIRPVKRIVVHVAGEKAAVGK